MQRMIVCAVAQLGFVAGIGATQDRTAQSASGTGNHMVVAPEELKWQALPTNWADGPPPAGFDLGHTEVAIIQGDPTKEGVSFVFRLRSTPGTQLPPHWHAGDEHVTVISGTWCVGMGERFDANGCRDMGPGSFIFIPKGMRHFAVAKGDVVQVYGIGPFTIHWVRQSLRGTDEPVANSVPNTQPASAHASRELRLGRRASVGASPDS